MKTMVDALVGRRLAMLASVLAMTLLASCASHGGGTGANSISVSGKSYDQVWRATSSTMGQHLSISESSKSQGVIRASSRVGVATWGELVTAQITPPRVGAGTYTVRVDSRKRIPTQITGTNWTPTILGGIRGKLGQ